MFKHLILLGILALTSCGRFLEEQDNSYLYPTVSEAERQRILNAQVVTCDDPSQCPEAIGKVAISTPKGVGQCTAFLIEQDTIMTNGHCLPQKFLKTFYQCENKIRVIFPNTHKKAPMDAKCSQVLRHSFGKGKLDYTIIKLNKKLDRKPIKLNINGIKERQDLTIWTMSPLDLYHGVISNKKCTGVHNSLLIPKAINKMYPYMVMGDCSTRPGNSGSPILNSQGEVVALSSSTFKPTFLAAVTKGKILLEDIKPVSKAENIGCMDFRSIGKNGIPTVCRNYSLSDPYVLRKRPESDFKETITRAQKDLKQRLLKAQTSASGQVRSLSTNITQRINGLQVGRNQIQVSAKESYQVEVGFNGYLQEDYQIIESSK